MRQAILLGFVLFAFCSDVVGQNIHQAIESGDLDRIRQLGTGNTVVLNSREDRTGRTAIHVAIDAGNLEAVKLLLDLGASVNGRSRNGQSPLHAAMAKQNTNIIGAILIRKPKLDVVDQDKMSPMMYAVVYKLPGELIVQLIDAGAEFKSTTQNAQSMLHLACNYGHEEAAQLFIERGLDCNALDSAGTSPIMSAAHAGLPRVVELMLKNGADPQRANTNGQTALHFACQSGSVETVKLLLDRTDDVNVRDQSGQTPLTLAVMVNNTELIELLIKRGADANIAPTELNWPPLLSIASSLGNHLAVKLLLDAGAKIDQTDASGNSALHQVANFANIEATGQAASEPERNEQLQPFLTAIKLLLASGADPLAQNQQGQSAIQMAINRNFFAAVELLIQNVVPQPQEIATEYGNLLHWASANGQANVVSRVIQAHMLDVDAQNAQSQSALNLASLGGHWRVVEMLIEAGANVNYVDGTGHSSLLLAATRGHAESIATLIAGGADKNAVDTAGQSALHLAAWSGRHMADADAKANAGAIKVLLDSGLSANVTTSNGYTPLHAAAWQGHSEIVTTLLDRGAAIDSADSDGWTPLHKAAFRGHLETAKILLDRGANAQLSNAIGITAMQLAMDQDQADVVAILKENASR